MSASKRERDQARKRYEKWQARQVIRQRKHRRNTIIGSVAGVIVVAAVVVAMVLANHSDEKKETKESLAAAMSEASMSASFASEEAVESASAAAASQASEEAEESAAASPSASSTGEVPDKSVAQNRTWTGKLKLGQGTLGLQLDGKDAPQAVANFVTLAKKNFFNDTNCHRLTTSGIYVLQCGDPTGTGTGGPGYTWGPIENAPTNNVYPAGTLAMARTGNDGNSMGSQFFIVYKDSTIPSDSAGGYTVFGKITSGLDTVTQIAAKGVEPTNGTPGTDGTPAETVTIKGVTVK
ncbi:MAG: peptidylprolyl isomerase [Bifidobacteriaceae bacterium]|jgi:peptidyl-prolyl cis-trans isomerase B (cyclophilin B)|nr:peptidylprolyl isomerase [Bifidobacteriaceae bacterium]